MSQQLQEYLHCDNHQFCTWTINWYSYY